MTVEERTQLRDKIINYLQKYKLIMKLKNGHYRRKNSNIDFSMYPELQSLYNTYISEFRSTEEADYCLLHEDDYINHICPVCKSDYCAFYNMSNGYRLTCQNLKCRQELIHTEDIKQKIIQTNREKYGVDWYVETEEFQHKAVDTNRKKRNCDYPTQDPSVIALSKQKKLDLYGNENYNNREKAEETCRSRYNAKCVMHVKKFVDLLKQRHKEKNEIRNEHLNQNVINIIKQLKNTYKVEELTLSDIYYNDDYLTTFIKYMYMQKGELLRTSEISYIFKRHITTIEKKMIKLNLINYFLLKDSELELQFRDFLIDSGFIEKEDFERRNRDILHENEYTGKSPEIDFHLKDYNLCFEINDIDSHNIGCKNELYHYNKTIQCLEKSKRLIHLWEWELTDSILWSKISNWIFNLLDTNRIQLNIFEDEDSDIRLVSKEDQIAFLEQYSLDNHRNFDKCIGIYYNDELIEVLVFKDNILSICIKFGYNIIKGTKEIIESYMKCKNLDYILTYVDLSKFTGKTFEAMGFKLLGYQEPDKICKHSTDGKFKCLYNCGQNIYTLTL